MQPSANFEDRQSFSARLLSLRISIIVVFSLMAVAFWIFQVVEHQKYEDLADRQHIRTLPQRAPRGILYDRNGKVLVRNTYSFTIALVREQSANVTEAVRRVAAATASDEARLQEIVAASKRRKDPSYRPIPLIEHATMAQVAAITARQVDLPEIIVQQLPTREYPEGGMAAHLFGYIGEIQEAQLQRPEFAGLQVGALVGQTGLERTYNALLQGTDGTRTVAVNSRGREIEKLGEDEPVDGDRLQLTVDGDVQKAMEDSFKHEGYNGAGAIMDPRTGEILALTSLPSYDPNEFSGGLDGNTYMKLLNDPLHPFLNRVIQGSYSPGSSFKIVMSTAALEEGVITPETKIFCPGYYDFGGRRFKCSRPDGQGHGVVDVRRALEISCNVFYYMIGAKMNIDTIHAYAEKMGLTGKTGVDLPNENGSLVPSTDWANRVRKSPWYPGETISVSIGQGAVNVTPLGLATMVSTIANGGTLVTPHILKAVDKGKGWESAGAAPVRSQFFLKPENLQAIRDGLWNVVNSGNGTGGNAKIAGRDVSGKTGTAQLIGNEAKAATKGKTEMDLRDHGFFVFFAPRDNPEIAGIFYAEHGLHGSTAALVARHAIETYFAKKDGLPLPVLKPKDAALKANTAPAATPAAAAVPAGTRGGGAGRQQ